MNIKHAALVPALTLAMAGMPAFALTTQEQANEAIVLAQMQAMAQRDVAKASSYLADGYIQHNPMVPTGKAGFVGFFGPRWAGQKPGAFTAPAEVVVEGDLVMVMQERPRPEPSDPTKTYNSFWFDLYRVDGGKIVEHWDGATKPAK